MIKDRFKNSITLNNVKSNRTKNKRTDKNITYEDARRQGTIRHQKQKRNYHGGRRPTATTMHKKNILGGK